MSTRRGGWRLHFWLLWTGGALSSLGSITLGLAFPLLALAQTGSPVVAGCVAAMGMVPRTLLHLPIGLLVDRRDPRTVMIVGQAVRVACVLGLAGPVLWLDAPVALLGAAAAVHGVCATCHSTAATTAVPYLVPQEELTGAAATNEARGHAAQLAGRPLGGGLFGLAHALPAVCDAVVTLVSLVLALRLPPIRPDRAAPDRTPLLHGLAQGFTQMRGDRFLLLTAVACTVTNALFQMIWLVILMLATQEGLSPLLLGVVLAASGAGGLLGSLVAPFTVSRRSPATMVTLCLWGWAAVTLLLAATDHSDVARLLVVLPLTWSGVGFVGAHINVTVLTYHSRNVPPEVLGRVTSTLRFLTGAALPAGVVSGGFLLDALGVRGTTLAVTGVIVALAVLFTVLTPPAPFLPRRLVRVVRSMAPSAPGRASPRSGAAARPTHAGPEPPPPRDLSPSARE